MKKFTLSLFFMGLITTSIFADRISDLEAGLKPACSELDLSGFTNKRYQKASSGATVARSYFDTKSIQIDKKNKTIDVWVSYILNASGEEKHHCGYATHLKHISYATNKMALKAIMEYQCDGTLISSDSNINDQISSINPDSMDEVLMERIVKKYNLK